MLKVSQLSKTIDNERILNTISFTIRPGQVVGLVGRNGAGKTTLFKTLAGIITPDAGTISFEGQSIHEHPQVKENIVFIPDQPEALLSYTPSDAALLYAQAYPAFDRDYFISTMNKLDIPIYRGVRHLSKGMRMMFSIALGLSTKARLVLLDEPTNGIDAIAKKEVLRLLLEAVEDGTTLMISSHLLSELERIADTVYMMKDGAIETQDLDHALNGAIQKFQVAFQVAFQGEAPEHWLSSTHVHILDHVGRVYTLLINTEHTGILDELNAFNPLLLEPLPLKLEDVFVWKLGGRSNVE